MYTRECTLIECLSCLFLPPRFVKVQNKALSHHLLRLIRSSCDLHFAPAHILSIHPRLPTICLFQQYQEGFPGALQTKGMLFYGLCAVTLSSCLRSRRPKVVVYCAGGTEKGMMKMTVSFANDCDRPQMQPPSASSTAKAARRVDN